MGFTIHATVVIMALVASFVHIANGQNRWARPLQSPLQRLTIDNGRDLECQAEGSK
jgi:hypothetical protein